MTGARGILPRGAFRLLGIVTAVVTAVLPGCAGRVADLEGGGASMRSATLPTLTFVDVVTMPAVPITGDIDRARHFGSLSGLVLDETTGRYLAVIDDRQPSRVAWLDIRFDGRLTVTPLSVEPLVPAPGIDPRAVTGADLEAIAALPDGSFVAVDEGHISDGRPGQPARGVWPAALLTIRPDATVSRVDHLPAMFDLGPEAGGIRENQGVESLTRTPDGRLIAGLEQPRFADLPATLRNGHPFGGGDGGPGRLFEFVQDGDAWRVARHWAYPLSPTTHPAGFGLICDDGENGLSDLLALDDTRLLALERACLISAETRLVRNTVRIYLADLNEADDVSEVASLVGSTARPVTKTLALDLDTLVPQLPASLARLDNFEALAFGPTLPDGRRSLLVVSDDNFRATQQTVVLLLAMNGLN